MMAFPPDYFVGKKATVMGLGHFGGQIAAIKFLAGQGAEVTVTDIAPAERLTESLKQIENLGVRLHLGGHVETDFSDADLIVVSPAVPKTSRYLRLAERAGVPFTCEMNLFLDRCRATVIGVTGTVGKSTTVAMLEHILRTAPGGRKVWAGGNIGKSLLEHVGQMEPSDWVVLELSSFQLADLAGIEFSPHVAVVTNLFPNHLDRHASLQEYIDAKANITRFQVSGDVLILNADDRTCSVIKEIAGGDVTIWRFGRVSSGAGRRQVTFSEQDGVRQVWSNVPDRTGPIVTSDELSTPGEHNVANAAAAASAALAVGVRPEAIGSALRGFRGLPDRLELVAEVDGVRWYNDSKSTTPQSGIVALRAFAAKRIVALAGGYDKELDLDGFAKELASRAKVTICLGQTGASLGERIRQYGGETLETSTLEHAVREASRLARPGECVVLSPGCASWDMFENYQVRGQQFRELVWELAHPIPAE